MGIAQKIVKTLVDASKKESPVRYIAAKILVKTGLCERLIINRDGYKLRFFATNVSVSMWLYGKAYYRDEETLIAGLLRPGDNFVDVGANIGHLSIVGKRSVVNGQVIAIEAHPQAARYANQNFELNKLDIELMNFAVGEKSGTAIFTSLFADDCNSIAQGNEKGISVEVRTLDNLLSGLAEIRLLKIDIEGYELFAFQGCIEVLQKTNYIFFEVMESLTQRYNYHPSEIVQLLEAAGFNIYRIDDSLEYELLSPNEDFSKLQNLLAVSSKLLLSDEAFPSS